MHSISADYTENFAIPPEDVIPKSSTFKFVKTALIIELVSLIIVAIITLIVTESFVSTKHKDAIAIGVVSMVGIILFFTGLIAVFKEHIPLILTFCLSMIFYLLVFMYARVIYSKSLILLRTILLLMLAAEAFWFVVLIRDWRQIQISRLNQRMMREAQMAHYAAKMNGAVPPMSPVIANPYQIPINPYDVHDNIYSQIEPSTPTAIYSPPRIYEMHVR